MCENRIICIQIFTNVLILGANGQVAHLAIDLFLKETNAKLTLYLLN
jgi:hypothetical protein